jgi:predicted CXXCH cytochrome family protein
MKNKRYLIFGLLAVMCFNTKAQEAADNQACLKCHGQVVYEYYNDWTERTERKLMNPYFLIDSTRFSHGVHQMFSCLDCHSPDYESFPHSGELRMEQKYLCLDCHGGDETYAKYNFEGIEEAFLKSVHAEKYPEQFNCWSCHDSHGYELALRTDTTIQVIVKNSNAMCLSCHDNKFTYQRMAGVEPPNVYDIHSWLPNQIKHFSKVRCLDCHTTVQEGLLVSHQVLGKEKAVRNCVQCHSDNTLLMESLYAHRASESRQAYGFLNATIMNESYVIGANRNQTLNRISIGLFGLMVIGLIIHFLLRVILIKKK